MPQCFHISQCSLSGTVLFWSQITNYLNTFALGITTLRIVSLRWTVAFLHWTTIGSCCLHHHLSVAQCLSHTGELLAGKWSWQGVVFRSGVNVSPAENVMSFPRWNSSHALAVGLVEFGVFLSLLLWNKWNVLIVNWCKVKGGGLNGLPEQYWTLKYLHVSFQGLEEGTDTCTW